MPRSSRCSPGYRPAGKGLEPNRLSADPWRNKEGPIEREYYRLVYPLKARPLLRLSGFDLEVVDLSEEGIRLLLPTGLRMAVGEEFAGRLRLHSGPTLEIEGVVLRVTPPQVAARLLRGVPFGQMLEEQRVVNQRFTARS
jgi:hypothetical protein